MTQAQALLRLQDIELEIRQKRQRLREIASALQDNTALAAAQREVERAEAALKPLRTRLRDLELEEQANRAKQKSTEDKLYSGKIKNPKELTDLQREVEALKKWQGELENRMLALMMEIEEGEAALAQARERLAQVEAEAAARRRELSAEQASLEAALEELSGRRQAAQASLDETALKIYQELRPHKGNRPVAILKGPNCGVCGVAQTTATLQAIRHGDQLVYCANCGRILAMQ